MPGGGWSEAVKRLPHRELPPIPHFRAIVGGDPYPWQRRFFGDLVEGALPEAVDIPTGMGKTACVLLAVLARLTHPELPRRIVYIVDRRTLVDQTASCLRSWIDRIGAVPELVRASDACAAFPGHRPVGLGVLRGGLADDGGWRVDPARPTVIVGTVDMVGSRLLFRGYGAGRSRQAMDAGLVGHDTLIMLDEAHLAPVMAELLRALARLEDRPEFRVVTLSATRVAECARVVTLEADDLEDERVRRRLDAPKTACFRAVAKDAARIGAMCEAASAYRTGAIAVCVERVADARGIAVRLARVHGAERVAVLTGTLRGLERSALVGGAVWRRFLPDRERTRALPSVYLVMTSAGEVGVDIDADHAVLDLAPLDSMIQRAGRVNRAGMGSATVTVVHEALDSAPVARPETVAGRLRAARHETLGVLRSLADLSPETLRHADQATLSRCSVSRVTNARVDPVVIEAYAMTSADLVRPPVEVYLRGIAEEPAIPETWLAWRRDVADLVRAGPEAAEAALSFYRPRAAELARVPVGEAKKIVEEALRRQEGRGLPLVVVRADGEVHATRVHAAAELPSLAYATLVLPCTAGGLAESGLPGAAASDAVGDVGDTPDRIRYVAAGDEAAAGLELPAWAGDAVELRIEIPDDEDGGEERMWVYTLRRPGPDLATGAGEMTWVGGSPQTLEEHGRRVGQAIRRIGEALGLPRRLVEALVLAGEWHDAGKSRRVWQLAAGVPADGPALAKSRKGRFRSGWLGGYRHEFGSVADAERSLPADIPHRDLILHLIAAHHGWARPGFSRPQQWDPEASPAENRALAARIADRYARLSAEHGPWRLAWFEALVKAADAWVSRGRSA